MRDCAPALHFTTWAHGKRDSSSSDDMDSYDHTRAIIGRRIVFVLPGMGRAAAVRRFRAEFQADRSLPPILRPPFPGTVPSFKYHHPARALLISPCSGHSNPLSMSSAPQDDIELQLAATHLTKLPPPVSQDGNDSDKKHDELGTGNFFSPGNLDCGACES